MSEIRTIPGSPICWQQDGEARLAGIVPAVGEHQALFWIQRSEFLAHWAAPARYRWTLTSVLPGLRELSATADGKEVPEALLAQAEGVRQEYVSRLNGITVADPPEEEGKR